MFDVQALVELILASGMPHAEWWADLWSPDGLPPAFAPCACGPAYVAVTWFTVRKSSVT